MSAVNLFAGPPSEDGVVKYGFGQPTEQATVLVTYREMYIE